MLRINYPSEELHLISTCKTFKSKLTNKTYQIESSLQPKPTIHNFCPKTLQLTPFKDVLTEVTFEFFDNHNLSPLPNIKKATINRLLEDHGSLIHHSLPNLKVLILKQPFMIPKFTCPLNLESLEIITTHFIDSITVIPNNLKKLSSGCKVILEPPCNNLQEIVAYDVNIVPKSCTSLHITNPNFNTKVIPSHVIDVTLYKMPINPLQFSHVTKLTYFVTDPRAESIDFKRFVSLNTLIITMFTPKGLNKYYCNTNYHKLILPSNLKSLFIKRDLNFGPCSIDLVNHENLTSLGWSDNIIMRSKFPEHVKNIGGRNCYPIPKSVRQAQLYVAEPGIPSNIIVGNEVKEFTCRSKLGNLKLSFDIGVKDVDLSEYFGKYEFPISAEKLKICNNLVKVGSWNLKELVIPCFPEWGWDCGLYPNLELLDVRRVNMKEIRLGKRVKELRVRRMDVDEVRIYGGFGVGEGVYHIMRRNKYYLEACKNGVKCWGEKRVDGGEDGNGDGSLDDLNDLEIGKASRTDRRRLFVDTGIETDESCLKRVKIECE